MPAPKCYITYSPQVGGVMVTIDRLLFKAHKEHCQRSVKHVEATLIINENTHEGFECPC